MKSNLLHDFISIITLGSKSNTYKFALARSILDYVKKNEDQILENIKKETPTPITYSEIAKMFLQYYWHQEFKFKIRQNHQVDKPPSIIVILQKIFDKEAVPEKFDFVSKEQKNSAEKLILRKVFGKEKQKTSQVIPRFQNIREGKITVNKNPFYINKENDQLIQVNPDAMEFFIHYRVLLEKLVILEWAKFLEKIKPVPGLVSKIEDPEPERKSLKAVERELSKFFNECFYCARNLNDTKIHVDHFVPWSYIFEDKRWNFVLACSDCNLKKSNSLTDPKFLEKIIGRNNDYSTKLPLLGKSLLELDEGRGWEKEIRRHYRNCKEYGFSEVKL